MTEIMQPPAQHGAVISFSGVRAVLIPTSPEQAAKNMESFVALLPGAVRYEPIIEWDPDNDGLEYALSMSGTKYSETQDGRYPFRLWINGERHLVEMCGLPLEQVAPEKFDPWDTPRIYMDGSTWLWGIAAKLLSDPEYTSPWKEPA